MTTTDQNQPPRPDWSQVNLPPDLLADLHRLYAIETKLRCATAMGSAFLCYASIGEPPDRHLDTLRLAWHLLIEQDIPAWD